jgi:hypothetical protein
MVLKRLWGGGVIFPKSGLRISRSKNQLSEVSGGNDGGLILLAIVVLEASRSLEKNLRLDCCLLSEQWNNQNRNHDPSESKLGRYEGAITRRSEQKFHTKSRTLYLILLVWKDQKIIYTRASTLWNFAVPPFCHFISKQAGSNSFWTSNSDSSCTMVSYWTEAEEET